MGSAPRPLWWTSRIAVTTGTGQLVSQTQFANVPGMQGTDLGSLLSMVQQAQAQNQDPQERRERSSSNSAQARILGEG